MALIDIDALLAPVSADAPTGENLEYSGIAELERLATGKQGAPDPNTREVVIEEPEWRKVREAAIELFARTKDLRAAVILCRSLLALGGLPGLGEGLQLLLRVTDTYWDTVYPPLDAEENNDPVERLNALANLDDANGIIRSLRSTRFLESREAGNFTLRDLDLALGRIAPPEGTQAPGKNLLVVAWRTGDEQANAQRRAGVESSLQSCNELIKLFRDRANDSPNIDVLRQSLKRLKDFYDEAADDGEAVTDDASASADGAASPVATGGGAKAGGALASREDAVRSLTQIANFIRKTEPSSPAPMFIDRAVKLLQADFATIVRDLMPDSKERIEMLGGISLDPAEPS